MPVPSVSMIALLRPARLAAAPLGEHRRVGVVVDDDGQPEPLGQQVAHGDAAQRQMVGVQRDAGLGIDQARDPEARPRATSPGAASIASCTASTSWSISAPVSSGRARR